MKNLGRIVTAVVVVGGSGAGASMSMVACNGDTTMDGGPDVMNDNSVPDSAPDVVPLDASDASDGDAGNPVVAFMQQETMAFCKRFQTCCNAADAGPFDYNQCLGVAHGGWYGANASITAEILARGNVTVNQTSASSCLAGVATLSCPKIPASEVQTVTPNCYDAIVGTLTNGGACIDSTECQQGHYCKFAGVDGGTTDAGSAIGQCATLIAQGQPCGQALPYGDPNELSTECEYKNWSPPGNFCDYDTYPDAAGYTCQPLRANNASCFYPQECASGICGTIGQNCFNTTCTCLTTTDFTPICNSLAIKDAGPG
jgi:hypothetical protein